MAVIKLKKFSAEWCGPCKRYNPIIDSVLAARDDAIRIDVDIDTDPEEAIKYGVQGVPTTILFDESDYPLVQWTGAINAKQLNEVLDKYVQLVSDVSAEDLAAVEEILKEVNGE